MVTFFLVIIKKLKTRTVITDPTISPNATPFQGPDPDDRFLVQVVFLFFESFVLGIYLFKVFVQDPLNPKYRPKA